MDDENYFEVGGGHGEGHRQYVFGSSEDKGNLLTCMMQHQEHDCVVSHGIIIHFDFNFMLLILKHLT